MVGQFGGISGGQLNVAEPGWTATDGDQAVLISLPVVSLKTRKSKALPPHK